MMLWVESDLALMRGPVDVHEYDEANGGVWATEKLPKVSKPQSATAIRARGFMLELLKMRHRLCDPLRNATVVATICCANLLVDGAGRSVAREGSARSVGRAASAAA